MIDSSFYFSSWVCVLAAGAVDSDDSYGLTVRDEATLVPSVVADHSGLNNFSIRD